MAKKQQTVFIKIQAESPDGEHVSCETQVQLSCNGMVAVSVFNHAMKSDPVLADIARAALELYDKEVEIANTITQEEFDQVSPPKEPPVL